MKLDSCWMMLEILIFWDMYIFCQNRPVEPVMIHQDAMWLVQSNHQCHMCHSPQSSSLGFRPGGILGCSRWGQQLTTITGSTWLAVLVLSRLTVVREFCLGSIHCASCIFSKKNKWKPIFLIGEAKVYLRKPWFLVSSFWKTWNQKNAPRLVLVNRQGLQDFRQALGDATHGTWKLWMITMVDSALIWNYYTMICILYSLWTYIRPWKITTIRWNVRGLGGSQTTVGFRMFRASHIMKNQWVPPPSSHPRL